MIKLPCKKFFVINDMKKIIHCFLSTFILFWISVPAFAQPVANFIGSPISGCAPLTVTFTDQSQGTPTSWNWNFGNTNTSTLQNPSASYTTPGTYTVTLTAINASGSHTKTRTAYITVFANPIASFTINPDTVCVSNPVLFISTSTNGSGVINHWRWTFGDGVVVDSSLNAVSHPYTFVQQFPVSLIVTDNHGCTSTANSSVVVTNGPVANFTATPLSSCTAPLTVNFTNTSTGGVQSYSWQFGDGGTSTGTSPSHTYSGNGIYTVTLHAISPGCTSTLVKTAYIVVQNTNANFSGDTAICIGSTAHFNDNTLPADTSRTWNFGDLTSLSSVQNPSHQYASSGTYTVTLIASANGCTDTVVKTILVHDLPVVSFSLDDSIGCNIPFSVNFTDHTAGGTSSWLWAFGDGVTSALQNPSHTYTSSGYFDVSLTVTNSFGCTSYLADSNKIYINPPVANFITSVDSGCAPFTTTFTSTSISNQPIISYFWNFGDDTLTTSTGTINHTYPATGIYDVSLVITTQGGCIDTIIHQRQIRVGTPPTANFSWTPDSICYGQTVSFTDLSSSSTAWHWYFGDGGASFQHNPTYQYQDTGLFSVMLIAYNNGCPDTVVHPDIIRVLPPYPLFSYLQNCANPYSVTFTDQSKGADSLVWDFGDGIVDTTNVRNPVHVYTTRGVKIITQIAYNYATGCSYAFTVGLIITEPIARFNQIPVTGCYPLTVSFSDTSQDANSHTWNFGDPVSGFNNVSSQLNPQHTYNLPGFYSVTLSINDVHGCPDVLTKTNIIHVWGPLPGFSVNDTTGCAPLNVIFTDTSLANGSPINQYHWNFGDGNSTTVSIPSTSHLYPNPGNYTVTLTVTDTNGCVKTISRPGIQPTFPHPSFTAPNFACPNQSVLFNASATSTAPGSTYTWSFGDGGTSSSTASSVLHSYIIDSNYVVTLTVTDFNGCDSAVSHTVHVSRPVANFSTSAIDTCDHTSVSFTDLSTGNVNSWVWNIGTGIPLIVQNPQGTYTTPGYYNVTLTVTSSAGCSDSITKDSIVVVPGPLGNFSFIPDSGCSPLTVFFSGTSNNALFYTWDFGDGTVVSHVQQDTITHIYTHDQIATPNMLLGFTLSSGYECQRAGDNLTGPVRVITHMIVNIDSISVSLSEGDEISLHSTVNDSINGPPYMYAWSPPQLTTCATCANTSITASQGQGSSYYYLEVTDIQGCRARDSVYVIFIPCEADIVIPTVFTPNADGLNDSYYIEHFCPGDFHFTIYNRWGRIVYESSDPHFHWDGKTTGGTEASEGTYYYVCNTAHNKLHGFLELIRK